MLPKIAGERHSVRCTLPLGVLSAYSTLQNCWQGCAHTDIYRARAGWHLHSSGLSCLIDLTLSPAGDLRSLAAGGKRVTLWTERAPHCRTGGTVN